MNRSQGVNVLGFLSAATGLGAAARETVRLLEALSIPQVSADFDLGEQYGYEAFQCARVSDLRSLVYTANLFHMNPPQVLRWALKWSGTTGLNVESRVNAIVPFWELPELTSLWRDVISELDLVLAPSRFVADAIRSSVGDNGPEILRYPQAVYPPEGVVPNRSRWLPGREDAFAVLFTFSAGSEIERKNPAAAVRAFESAFATSDDAVLLLKVAHADLASGAQWDYVARAAETDPRIVILNQMISRRDMWELTASVDAYLSLHRSEGLGLGMMEAMALGKPVVATGWSGNMDFMDDSCASLVPFELVQVGGVAHPQYSGIECLRWADPDWEAAAVALGALASTPARASELGKAAAERILAIQVQHARGDALKVLSDAPVGTSDQYQARGRRITTGARRAYAHYRLGPTRCVRLKRRAVRLLRKVGLRAPGPEAGPPDAAPPRLITGAGRLRP